MSLWRYQQMFEDLCKEISSTAKEMNVSLTEEGVSAIIDETVILPSHEKIVEAIQRVERNRELEDRDR